MNITKEDKGYSISTFKKEIKIIGYLKICNIIVR